MSDTHRAKLAPLPMARLSCGHYQRITVPDARAHAEVVCLKCHQLARPDVVLTREWLVYCRTPGCHWSRWVGQSKVAARKAMGWHTKDRKYDHNVRMDYAVLPGLEYTQLITPTATPTTPSEDDNNDCNDRPHLF